MSLALHIDLAVVDLVPTEQIKFTSSTTNFLLYVVALHSQELRRNGF